MPKTDHQIHPTQAAILKVVLYRSEARFSELNTEKLPTDQFTFHIKELLRGGILEKTGGRYRLTAKGKEFANRFDTDSGKPLIEHQAKIGAMVTCIDRKEQTPRYLIQQRLKHPYYGYHGFLTGKVKWGESVYETAARELEEETGLSADLTLYAITHKRDFDTQRNLLEDKYFFVFLGEKAKGVLKEEFPGGKNFWLTEREFLKLPEIYDDVKEVLKVLKKKPLVFLEQEYQVERY